MNTSKLKTEDTSLIALEKQMVLDKANNFTEGSTIDFDIHLLEILAICLWVSRGDARVITSHCLCPRVWVVLAILLRGHKSLSCCYVAHS